MIRLLLVEDHPIVRVGLRALFDAEADLTVVGEATTMAQALERTAGLAPDLVLMDLVLAGGDNGAEATRALRSRFPDVPVLVLTNYDTDGDILRAIEAGASGYLLKDSPPEVLLPAVRAAAAGESALAPQIAARLLDRMRTPTVSLTSREIEILAAVATGEGNARIAADLFITEQTVKSHLAHIYTKLGVTSRTAAVARAREEGILR